MAITDKGDNTGNVFIDALAAYSFLDIGGDRNITYTLATGGNVSAHPWAPLTEKGQWQNALQQWVNVANITTQEVFTSDADLREAWVDTGQMTTAHGLGPNGLPYPKLSRSSAERPWRPQRDVQQGVQYFVLSGSRSDDRRLRLLGFPA